MIQDAFSSRLLRQIETARPGTVLDAIAKNCAELGVAALFVLRKNPIIWLVGENENLEEKRERLKCWLRFLEVEPAGIHIYPLPFADPYINNLPEVRKIEWKGELLQDIFRQRRVLVLSTLAALNIPLERDLELADIGCPIRKDTPIGRDAFIARAKDLGYLPRPVVEDKGDIAWRGNLVDLFAVNSDAPLRLEFEGERIVSLRQFDLSSQRSIGPVNDFFISANRFFYSAGQEPHPWIHSGKGTAYLNEALADPLLVVSNLIKLNGEHEKLLLHFQKIFDSLSDERSAWPAPATLFPRTLSAGAVIRLEDFPLDPQRGQEIVGLPYSISTLNATDLAAIQERLSRGYRLYLFSSETQIADNLKSLLPVQGHHAFSLPLSFENLERQTLFLTDRRFVFREKRELFREINVEKWIQEIRPGERVVHRVHGIGCFSAFQRLSFEGETVEFLKIEYQNQEYLYVPVYDLDALTRYVAPEGALPKLDRLGGKPGVSKRPKPVAVSFILPASYSSYMRCAGRLKNSPIWRSPSWKKNWNVNLFMSRPRIRKMQSVRCWLIWKTIIPWIACCAVMSVSGKPRWPSVLRCGRLPTSVRLPFFAPPPYWLFSTIRPFKGA